MTENLIRALKDTEYDLLNLEEWFCDNPAMQRPITQRIKENRALIDAHEKFINE